MKRQGLGGAGRGVKSGERRRVRRRRVCLGAVLLLVACVGSAVAAAAGSGTPCSSICDTITLALRLPRGASIESVGGPLPVRPVGQGFIGLSIEYYAVRSYAGDDPGALNPVFLQLVRNLAPGQSPVLRIGGDSADWAWVPSRGISRPAGARLTITPGLLRVLAVLGARLHARFIFDLDLEADNVAVARAEARALLRIIGRAHIGAFELGNEPELYSVLGWYQVDGHPVLGRSPGYNLGDYQREFDRLARHLPPVPLAGPASGDPLWSGDLESFAASAPRLAVVTVHRYPLQRCQKEPGTPEFPTIAELIAPQASLGLAQSVVPQAAAAHAHRESIRVDELNSVACFGAPGVSNTFASALWALETSFAMARVGVDGLNFHTLPAAAYGLFSFRRIRGHWLGHVAPDYYGLLTFARVAPPGSKMLSTSGPSDGLQTWATEAPTGAIHVVLINTGPSLRTVGVRIPAASGPASLTYLRSPALSSGSVTLNGRTFGGLTSTGTLSETAAGKPVAVRPVSGNYVIRAPTPSAALLTLSVQHSPS